ncbi:MAG: hypothetical protein RL064_1492 [Bacteroidota bacterium]
MRNPFTLASIVFVFTTGFINSQTVHAQSANAAEKQRWEKHVKQTTIIRDEWDIPHIYGKTDADAVFGLMYAQCEENYPQIEKNYLEMLGRTAEKFLDPMGDKYADLMMRLIQDSADAIADYNASPLWFKKLLTAHADGINYYLYKHPETKTEVIKKYKPWYHLMWTDGSVSPTRTGGVKRDDVYKMYSSGKVDLTMPTASVYPKMNAVEENGGSNGFAIAPKHSKNGNALLYINPHVPFYFRSEMHMVSEEGLNAYGAVTWGQLFIYQGFNERVGWMHTSSYADVADIYEEKIIRKNDTLFYEYEKELIPVQIKKIPIKYYGDNNGENINTKIFTTYRTHHGPIMGSRNGNWISLRENNRSLNALLECWIRTKANNLSDYKKALSLLANNSNNTVYADADGNIAYWHGNFMPKRASGYDFTKPVDGSIKATNWNGIHALEEIVQSINPANGWLQNCNATPFTVAGKYSPDPNNYPAYMAPDGENARGLNAVRLLTQIDKLDLNDLIKLGYNKHLTAFDILLPPFIEYSKTVALTNDQQKAINYLASWNHDADTNSIAQTIAIEWASRLQKEIAPAATEEEGTQAIKRFNKLLQEVSNERKLAILNTALEYISVTYHKNSWEIPWGQINRYQRGMPNSEFPFSDNRPSIAVAQTSSKWGQLPSFESMVPAGAHMRYGYSGNSFIAAVSFGKKLEAKTIITGGQSRFPNSKHFTDQAQKYIDGDFKTIHFYKADVLANKVTSYKPGFER